MSLPSSPSEQSIFRLADLSQQRPTGFDIRPDADQRLHLAKELGFRSLRKLRFTGKLVASGKRNWALTALLGATIEQECVVTLQPVVTRLDGNVKRRFVPADDFIPDDEQIDEYEMPSDESLELLSDEIDLFSVLREALAVEAPDYPRAPGATLNTSVFSEPGVAPMTDTDAKPFSGLAKLKEKLQKDS